MANKQTPIIWENEIVGMVEDLKVDMFDLYGKWLPLSTALTQQFLKALRAEEELEVQVGFYPETLKGRIYDEPDQQINIKYWPER